MVNRGEGISPDRPDGRDNFLWIPNQERGINPSAAIVQRPSFMLLGSSIPSVPSPVSEITDILVEREAYSVEMMRRSEPNFAKYMDYKLFAIDSRLRGLRAEKGPLPGVIVAVEPGIVIADLFSYGMIDLESFIALEGAVQRGNIQARQAAGGNVLKVSIRGDLDDTDRNKAFRNVTWFIHGSKVKISATDGVSLWVTGTSENIDRERSEIEGDIFMRKNTNVVLIPVGMQVQSAAMEDLGREIEKAAQGVEVADKGALFIGTDGEIIPTSEILSAVARQASQTINWEAIVHKLSEMGITSEKSYEFIEEQKKIFGVSRKTAAYTVAGAGAALLLGVGGFALIKQYLERRKNDQ